MNVLTKTAKQSCPGEPVAVSVGGRLETTFSQNIKTICPNDIRFNTAFTRVISSQCGKWEVDGMNGSGCRVTPKKWTDIHISQIMRKKIQEDIS